MLAKLRKLFFGIDMTWGKVIIFAIATAILAAFCLFFPVLANSSFNRIGVTFEAWIFFALIIIMNCKKPLEAGAKTFIFFLISQPLIYLLQVPFNVFGWGIFMYYPRWFIWTLLTFPGAIVAWYVKKDNIISGVILAVATAFLGYMMIDAAISCVRNFPNNLLAVIFMILEIVIFIMVLLKNKKAQIVATIITLVVTVGLGGYHIYEEANNPYYNGVYEAELELETE